MSNQKTFIKESKLKPCPFCGEDAELIEIMPDMWVVGCDGDYLCNGNFNRNMVSVDKSVVIKAWNRRAK